jgi:NTE family protein
VQINAADLVGGNRFTFFQPQFDLICSDLSQLTVARAVAASSAVPGVFTPITLRSYAGHCGFEPPGWFAEAGTARPGSLRRLLRGSPEFQRLVATLQAEASRSPVADTTRAGGADNAASGSQASARERP